MRQDSKVPHGSLEKYSFLLLLCQLGQLAGLCLYRTNLNAIADQTVPTRAGK